MGEVARLYGLAKATSDDILRIDANIDEIKTGVSGLKTDVAGLKSDMTEVRADVAALKSDVHYGRRHRQGVIRVQAGYEPALIAPGDRQHGRGDRHI